ncbi:MAG: hypothetical protein KatS3mg055_3325 [Chloroflexus sp.]|uniref:anti-sigma factor n=1 Tax=Chloroflexus sp. TaxID=1904827 RepID=UPI0021DC91BD|nr:anti-sigma factor [Chloroflexus sp.]GIV90807.1 MAG: hypothetical protein KatS3mg055_3325 [Chloroflexus sp.]
MITNRLSQWLTQTGDELYGFALVLAPDERAARRLLRQWAVALRSHPPNTWNDDELLTRLYQVATAMFTQPVPRRPAPPATPLLGPLRALSLPQRMVVLVYSVLGAEHTRLARIVGLEADEALSLLEQAVRQLAPAIGHTLSADVNRSECQVIHRAFLDPPHYLMMFEKVRQHLQTCPHCRIFEREWQETMRSLRPALRRLVQATPLPAAEFKRLLQATTAPRTRLGQLAPLVGLLTFVGLMTVIVLPGLFRKPFTVIATGAAEPTVSAAELVARALMHGGIPEPEGPPVWHARYQTIWYFNNRTVAPLYAEIWHDRDNPARHRLQLRHIEGGAPYEFQLGDGLRRLYYAIDGAYAPSLYGDLPIRALPNEPELVVADLDPTEQQVAFHARRTTGPWSIVPNYLHQAAAAPDLRLLGRQRIGERLAYIVSFRGISPVDLPADEAEPVTVLMAIGEQDGHVLSVTELIGPPGGTQTSRVVWRLVEFNWLVSGEQIRDAFTFVRVWNGRAEATSGSVQDLFDPAWPLVRAGYVVLPILSDGGNPSPSSGQNGSFGNVLRDSQIIPAELPPGIEHAMLLRLQGPTLNGAIYSGPGKRLVIAFDRLPGVDASIPVEIIGPWRVRIEPMRGQRYRVAIESNTRQRRGGGGGRLALDVFGFRRDELRALISSLQPIYRVDLSAQAALFGIK